MGLALLFKLIAGSAFSGVKGVAKWIGSLDLVHCLLLVACLFGGWQTIGRWSQHRHSAKVEKQLAACIAARAGDRADYAKAQADAAAQNRAAVAADQSARERITNDVSQSYQRQFASLRADLARRLRAQNGAAPSATGSTDLPGVSPAAAGVDGAAKVSIPTSLYVRGAELELQLEQLQHWITQQMKVDPNK